MGNVGSTPATAHQKKKGGKGMNHRALFVLIFVTITGLVLQACTKESNGAPGEIDFYGDREQDGKIDLLETEPNSTSEDWKMAEETIDLSMAPEASITFTEDNESAVIWFEDGQVHFKGDSDCAFKVFFKEFLQEGVDQYIKDHCSDN